MQTPVCYIKTRHYCHQQQTRQVHACAQSIVIATLNFLLATATRSTLEEDAQDAGGHAQRTV